MRQIVRGRVLELTIEVEKYISDITKITVESGGYGTTIDSVRAASISRQIIFGNVTNITATEGSKVAVVVTKTDLSGLIEFLTQSGIDETDAKELGNIIAAERPKDTGEALGAKAKRWLADNLKRPRMGHGKLESLLQRMLLKKRQRNIMA